MSARKPVVHVAWGPLVNACDGTLLGCCIQRHNGLCFECTKRHRRATCKRCLAKLKAVRPWPRVRCGNVWVFCETTHRRVTCKCCLAKLKRGKP